VIVVDGDGSDDLARLGDKHLIGSARKLLISRAGNTGGKGITTLESYIT
jgi:hypothetical protein